MTLLNFYTFIVMVLSPLTLTYIRFVKPFSFTSLYMGIAKFEDDATARHNQRVRDEKHKIYADDRYQFTYNKRNKNGMVKILMLKDVIVKVKKIKWVGF